MVYSLLISRKETDMTTYAQDLETSRECIALALAVVEIGGEGYEAAAWSVAKSDPLLNKDATKEAWLVWAQKAIAAKKAMQRAAR